MQRDQAAANKLTQMGIGQGSKKTKNDPTLLNVQWQELAFHEAESRESMNTFSRLT